MVSEGGGRRRRQRRHANGGDTTASGCQRRWRPGDGGAKQVAASTAVVDPATRHRIGGRPPRAAAPRALCTYTPRRPRGGGPGAPPPCGSRRRRQPGDRPGRRRPGGRARRPTPVPHPPAARVQTVARPPRGRHRRMGRIPPPRGGHGGGGPGGGGPSAPAAAGRPRPTLPGADGWLLPRRLPQHTVWGGGGGGCVGGGDTLRTDRRAHHRRAGAAVAVPSPLTGPSGGGPARARGFEKRGQVSGPRWRRSAAGPRKEPHAPRGAVVRPDLADLNAGRWAPRVVWRGGLPVPHVKYRLVNTVLC